MSLCVCVYKSMCLCVNAHVCARLGESQVDRDVQLCIAIHPAFIRV